MRKLLVVVLGLIILGCQERENTIDEFTGNELVYSLQSGSVYAISGTIMFKERKDGSSQVYVNLSGTEGNIELPVHLHLGDISEADADVAALLNPVNGSTGKSETHLKKLANELPISFADIKALNASIKIHLSETGPGRDIILAAGNIGSAYDNASSGRFGIGVCKSE
jgi:hypothetical protein